MEVRTIPGNLHLALLLPWAAPSFGQAAVFIATTLKALAQR
jgi:hypothetical protein